MANKIPLSKEQILASCYHWLNEKIERINASLLDLQQANTKETKSSAGDKYETSREMIQLEKNKLLLQLKIFLSQEETLKRIQQQLPNSTSFLGKTILTNKGLFFIGIGIGPLTIEEIPCFIVSEDAPITQSLKSNITKPSFSFRKIDYQIIAVN